MRSTRTTRTVVLGTIFALSALTVGAQGQTGSKLSRSEAKTVVDLHNQTRAEAGVKTKLVWDNKIAAYAQEWADYLASNSKFDHRPRSGRWKQKYGENLAGNSTVANGIKAWISEKKDYKGTAIGPKTPSKVYHYTQMIWDRSLKVGCGKAYDSKNRWWVIVCNYDPPGNVGGQKPLSGARPGVVNWQKWGAFNRDFARQGQSTGTTLPLVKGRQYKVELTWKCAGTSDLNVKTALTAPNGRPAPIKRTKLSFRPSFERGQKYGTTYETYVFTPQANGNYKLKFSAEKVKGNGGKLTVTVYKP